MTKNLSKGKCKKKPIFFYNIYQSHQYHKETRPNRKENGTSLLKWLCSCTHPKPLPPSPNNPSNPNYSNSRATIASRFSTPFLHTITHKYSSLHVLDFQTFKPDIMKKICNICPNFYQVSLCHILSVGHLNYLDNI